MHSVGTSLDVGDLVRRMDIALDVEDQAVRGHLIIVLDLDDVSNMEVVPWPLQEALVSSVEYKLLTVKLVDGVGRLLHLCVVEDVDGSLADQVDGGHTVDNVPGFILSLAKSR